jgi:hypothetical protein
VAAAFGLGNGNTDGNMKRRQKASKRVTD